MTERIAYETMTDFSHSFRFLPVLSPPQLNLPQAIHLPPPPRLCFRFSSSPSTGKCICESKS